MRTHGGADQIAVGAEGHQRLVDVRVVWRTGEAHPHVELRRADLIRVADVDGIDDSEFPGAFRREVAGHVGRDRGAPSRVRMPYDVVLGSAQQHQ